MSLAMSRVLRILIAESPQSPMVAQSAARLVPARGVVGDRYHDGVGTFSPHPHKPDFEVTLVVKEGDVRTGDRVGVVPMVPFRAG